MLSLFQIFFLPLAQLLVILFLGFFLGRGKILKGEWIARSLNLMLFFLLFVLGWRTGSIPHITSQLAELGVFALLLTSASLFGAWVVILIGQSLGLAKVPIESNKSPILAASKTSKIGARLSTFLKIPFIFLGVLVFGGFFGALSPWNTSINLDNLAASLVFILVFLSGLQCGASQISFKEFIGNKFTLILPVLTVSGSLLGVWLFSILAFPIFIVPPEKALSLSAGFGWYSLSYNILAGSLNSPILGTLSFLTNLFREYLAFFFIPLFARIGQGNLAISSGGATTMNVTLPVITHSLGSPALGLAIIHGLAISFVVPFLITFFFNLDV